MLKYKNMKNKLLVAIIIIIILLGSILVLRFLLGGPEDSWICEDEGWVKHGNPNSPMPESGCEPKIIGGQRDEHGCLIPAGYSWCQSKQKCLRIWEEGC